MLQPRSVFRIARVLVGLAAASCSAPPPERYLRLDALATTQAGSSHPALPGELQLLPFRARGNLADRHLVYLDPTGGFRPSATLLWEDVPPASVANVVARVLQANHVADAVLSPDTRGLAGFWLDGSIERFELVSMANRPARAVVQIQFTLFAGQERRPALIARYCRAQPEDADPARAFSLAVSAISTALAQEILANGPAMAATRPAVLIGQQIDAPGEGCGKDA